MLTTEQTMRSRRLWALMELKGLSLYDVAEKAKVGYTKASAILNGRVNDVAGFQRLESTIEKAPAPSGVHIEVNITFGKAA